MEPPARRSRRRSPPRRRTAAEIQVVVATESGRYDRAESIIGLGFGLAGMAAADLGWELAQGAGSWGAPPPLGVYALGVVLGFVVGSVLASYVHVLRHLLVSSEQSSAEVTRAAAALFTRLQVDGTAARAGVLVYLSLAEHKVVVVMDRGARDAAPDDFAADLCEKAVIGLREGRGADVLVEVAEALADQLEEALPAPDDDVDELADRVVVLHPR
jgi:putative membrane protein